MLTNLKLLQFLLQYQVQLIKNNNCVSLGISLIERELHKSRALRDYSDTSLQSLLSLSCV